MNQLTDAQGLAPAEPGSIARDPFALELIKNALVALADEMALTIYRTARSFVVKEALDFSTALFLPDGQLIALLYRNYGLSDQTMQKFLLADPTGFAGEPRRIDLAYTFTEEEDGCYQFSLLVTHLDNVDGEAQVADYSDVALLTWWFSVEDDEVPNVITDCPFPGGGEP